MTKDPTEAELGRIVLDATGVDTAGMSDADVITYLDNCGEQTVDYESEGWKVTQEALETGDPMVLTGLTREQKLAVILGGKLPEEKP